MKEELLRSVPEAAHNTRLKPAVSPVPDLNREMPIEIMRDFDTVLLFGRLAEAGPIHLRVERVSDEVSFPILDENSIMLVRGYDAQMAPVILWAAVVESSKSRCTVENLGRIYHQTERKFVRCPVCPPGIAQILADGRLEPPQLSQLINISSGGVCIVTKQPYAVQQSLLVRVGLTENSTFYPCQVVRITPRWGGFFELGLRFVYLDGAQREHLAREIQDIGEKTRKNLLPEQKHAILPDRSCPNHK